MKKGKTSTAERELAERLRREAEAYGPTYSAQLHRRLMAGPAATPGQNGAWAPTTLGMVSGGRGG